MNFRYKFSIVLIILGLMSAIMSFGGKNNKTISPEEILEILLKGEYAVSPDQLAELIVEQDSGLQIVDVRNTDKYKMLSIPGAVNIPLANILEQGKESLIGLESAITIFYSDNNDLSTQAMILSMQKGYRNLSILKGGLTEWESIIMKSEFTGDKISAEENALFEKRYKARRLFTQWNSMSDSLRTSFFATKQVKDKELVGGCE